MKIISKVLSRNDTGESKGHQAGFYIPRDFVKFFPALDGSLLNPRIKIMFKDENSKVWPFNYIYYNNLHFNGTRNEHRLTHTTGYIKFYKLKSSDTIYLSNENNIYSIRHEKVKSETKNKNINKIILKNKWKVIRA
tara:strand:+ start:152 stop:559 length:408 start_codon:yes stop_codon:yes gene_type:complete